MGHISVFGKCVRGDSCDWEVGEVALVIGKFVGGDSYDCGVCGVIPVIGK